MKLKMQVFILILLFSLPSVFFLFRSGFFQSDDGEWMIIRFSAFYQAFVDGQFPVRFLGTLNHGYGYPVANFLYPGFMYLGVLIHLLGFGFVDTIKIIFGASMISSAVFCFLWLSKFFDKFSSFVGSLFYLYTPYHLFDLYKRGSVGEALALSILPFTLWQIERRSLLWSGISIAALILSHNTLALLFLGLIILYMGLDIYVSKEKKEILKKYLFVLLLGLGISAFFWIPAVFELQYTVFYQTQVSEWNNYFSDIRLIGVSAFLVLFLTTAFFVASKIEIDKHRLTLLFLIIGILSVFFATSLSSPLWSTLPVSFIQFPFRFLSLTIVCVAFLAACVVSVLSKKVKTLFGILLLIILALSSYSFISPSEFFDKGEGLYSTNMDTTTVKNEYMPKWVKEKPIERFKEKVEIVEGVGKVESVSYNSKKIVFNVLSEGNTEVLVNTIYYPGWKAFIDNQRTDINYKNNKGVMDLQIPKGRHLVKLVFGETPMRLGSDILSIGSLLGLLIIGRRKKW